MQPPRVFLSGNHSGLCRIPAMVILTSLSDEVLPAGQLIPAGALHRSNLRRLSAARYLVTQEGHLFGRNPFSESLTKPPPIKCDQSLPVMLRGGLVVTPALREGETVVDTGIQFDLSGGPGPRKQRAELLDHRQRRQLVVLGAGNVEFALHLAQ